MSNSFLIEYNLLKKVHTVTSSDKIELSRKFNIYMKQVLISNNIDDIINLLLFINTLTIENDIYNLKSAVNICNLFKFINQNNLNVSVNLMISHALIDLLKYMEITYKLNDYKTNIIDNIISIVSNNLFNIDANRNAICSDLTISIESIDSMTVSQIIEELNLEIYNALVQFLVVMLNGYIYWLNNESLTKCNNILIYRKYVYKKILYNLNTILMNYYMPEINAVINCNNDILYKWNATYCNIENRMWLCDLLINRSDPTINGFINSFINHNKPLIETMTYNESQLNVIIDGMNIFYTNKDNYSIYNKIDVKFLLQVIHNIKKYREQITSLLHSSGAIKFHNTNRYNQLPEMNIHFIFNEMHMDVLKLAINSSGKYKWCNVKDYFIFTRKNINDDIIQLYLWLSYNSVILISKDKHSNYINKIHNNKYLLGLFTEYKNRFQLCF